MKNKFILTGLFIFLLFSICFAETSIKAEVDKAKITTDDTVVYKLIISSDEKNIPEPAFPKFESFKVLSSAQTSQIRFAKGIRKIGVIYVFILAPLDIGKFKIEPATIKIKNKTYSTDVFEIEVTQGKTQPQPKPEVPEKPQPKSEEPQYTL